MANKERTRQALRIALGAASLSWIVGSLVVRSSWVLPKRRSPPLGAPAADFTLLSLDGLRLAATFWPGAHDQAPGVLIVHGLNATRRVIQANADWLSEQGYGVLTIDLRGHGDSERAPHGLGWSESLDAHAALAWLKRRQGGAPVAAIGISMGGAALLLGPLGPVPAEALVLQGTFASLHRTIRSRIALGAGLGAAWLLAPLLAYQTRLRLGVWPGRLAPIEIMPRLACPVFVIGGEKDRFTPPDETRDLYEAAHGQKRLWIAPGLGHNGISDIASEAYREKLQDFLKLTLGTRGAALLKPG